MLGCAAPADADVIIHLRNNREIVARDYWRAGDWLMFSWGRGTVGVRRAFVAAVVALPAPGKIGGDPEAVNAAPAPPVLARAAPARAAPAPAALSPRGRSVTFSRRDAE